MIRLRLVVLLVLAGAASLVACGGSDDAGVAPSSAAADPTTAASDPLLAPVTDPADAAAAIPATASSSTTNSPVSASTVPARSDSTGDPTPPDEAIGAPTTTAATTTPPTIAPTTTSTTRPPVPAEPGLLDLSAEVVGLGSSVQGRPIHAERYGTPGGRRVLVIGVIHGDEDDGVAIVDDLRTRPVPEGIELWLVESMNPDGQAAQVRHNANRVDLNRNFPYNWGPIGAPGDGQYAGSGPSSEPETRAIVNFISQLDPELAIWYHQDLFVINPSTGREGAVRARYAELTNWPMGRITGGTYTGIAATWARQQLAPEGVAFIVELGPTLSAPDAASHASAVLTLATELPSL